MKVTILQAGVITNIIEADSVARALEFYPGAREWQEGDVIVDTINSDPDMMARLAYEAEQQAAKEADFAAYKARSGAPSYKAAAVKIAAEKLGVLDAINAAIMALVEKASDKSLYVWWQETPTISQGDAEWQQIEPAVAWGKVSVADLFALAAQI